MAWIDEYDKRRHEKAYDSGRKQAKRVKAGKEADDSWLHSIPIPVPEVSEYQSKRAGYNEEMARLRNEAVSRGEDNERGSTDLKGASSITSSYSESSFPLLKQSIGCLLVGGFLGVFGLMWFIATSFPDMDETTKLSASLVAWSCIIAGAIMIIWGFIPHEEGSGFFLFLALVILFGAGSVVIWFIRDFSDAQMRAAWGVPAVIGSLGILLGGCLMWFVVKGTWQARRHRSS